MTRNLALPALALLLASCGGSDDGPTNLREPGLEPGGGSGAGPLPVDDPAPADPGPVGPAPFDPSPTDPGPVDPAPFDPLPTDPGPVDPGPVDPEPVDSEQPDPGPVDPEPVDSEQPDPEPTDPEPVDSEQPDPEPTDPAPADDPIETNGEDVTVPPDLFERDGYGTVDVVRMDVRTVTTPGPCTADDLSGCTLADVIADTDKTDDLRVEIPVHFQATDFPDDGESVNASLRQRGASARQSSRKSFRIELDGKGVRWRGEDILQLNKHPHDASFIRNKLAFDLMRDIPELPSSRTQFVELWIDDGAGPVDYGLFTHDEAATKEFLVNRGWDTDGQLYKAEKFLFSLEDLEYMALDENGKPLDKDAFESRLEIEHGKDHRKVVEMVRALADKSLPFDDFLERHVDEDNLTAWVAVNFLLHQFDATTHNFYLYFPAESDTFHILPWDYDSTFAVRKFPANGFDDEALLERLGYGYARGSSSNLLKRFYRHPGTHEKVLAKAEELRNGPLSDARIAELASRYSAVVAPVIVRGPDASSHDADGSERFAEYVARSHDALRNDFGIPMTPGLSTPRVTEDSVSFSWSPALVVPGGSVTYDLELSASPGFERSERILFESGIPDEPERVRFEVPRERVPSGTHYVRLVARNTADPERYWQITSDRTVVDGETRIGIREFVVP